MFSSSNFAGIFRLILAGVSHFPESRSWTSPGEGFPALRGRETRVGFALTLAWHLTHVPEPAGAASPVCPMAHVLNSIPRIITEPRSI